jgi:isoleucyl-tRNA synthetase
MSISEEILKRVVETYRRIRNTLRFLLANVSDFDAARDLLPVRSWVEIDRYALIASQQLQAAVMHDYARYEFHLAAQKLHAFCSEFLGAFYLDILKDRLYTTGAASPARRSAQSALHHIAHSLLRLFAPVLSFTADEAWEVLVRDEQDSVFLHPLYQLPHVPDAASVERRWGLVREVRAEVQKELEPLRVKGDIGSSLDAQVEVRAAGDRFDALAALGDDLRFAFITSQARVERVGDAALQAIAVRTSPHAKCARCWHHRPDVGADPAHPDLCGRCVSNLFGAGEPRSHA